MEWLLNRWRGTGVIFASVTGTQIYAVYIALMIGMVSVWYWGLLAGAVFMVGEGMTWGKWVGYLSEPNQEPQLENKKGTGFPYIHQTAELFIKQTEDYRLYCQTALFIRGVYWWVPVLVVMALAGVISWWYVGIGGLIAGVGFPVACEIGKRWKYTLQSRWLNMSQGWENQEVVYGIIQTALVTLPCILRTIPC